MRPTVTFAFATRQKKFGAVVVPTAAGVDPEAARRSLIENGRAATLKPHELPQRIIVVDEPFTAANGLLSSGGGKLCRPALIARFRGQLNPSRTSGVMGDGAGLTPVSPRLCVGLAR